MISNSNKMYVVGYILDKSSIFRISVGLVVSQSENHTTILWSKSMITTSRYVWDLYTIEEAMNKISRYGSTNI